MSYENFWGFSMFYPIFLFLRPFSTHLPVGTIVWLDTNLDGWYLKLSPFLPVQMAIIRCMTIDGNGACIRLSMFGFSYTPIAHYHQCQCGVSRYHSASHLFAYLLAHNSCYLVSLQPTPTPYQTHPSILGEGNALFGNQRPRGHRASDTCCG